MKILLLALSVINGLYMLIDGLYVLLKGRYIGPEKLGPWAGIFQKMNLDVFKLGPMFIVFGLAWLAFVYGVGASESWAYNLGIGLGILTLWYLPFGTIIAIVTLVLLAFYRERLGI